jgi:hypothetical protein
LVSERAKPQNWEPVQETMARVRGPAELRQDKSTGGQPSALGSACAHADVTG